MRTAESKAEPADYNPIRTIVVKDDEPRQVLPPTDDRGRPLLYVGSRAAAVRLLQRRRLEFVSLRRRSAR